MKFIEKTPPRKFFVGKEKDKVIKDCGSINLESYEQVTFVTKSGKEYDVVRTDWGFYATPSINVRLKNFGFKTALVKDSINKHYIMLIEKEKINDFEDYLNLTDHYLLKWLDE